jgi:hypothetical protein
MLNFDYRLFVVLEFTIQNYVAARDASGHGRCEPMV